MSQENPQTTAVLKHDTYGKLKAEAETQATFDKKQFRQNQGMFLFCEMIYIAIILGITLSKRNVAQHCGAPIVDWLLVYCGIECARFAYKLLSMFIVPSAEDPKKRNAIMSLVQQFTLT